MWTRAELKSRGKYAFQQNYWKSVLISILVAVLMGSTTLTFSYRHSDETSDSAYDPGSSYAGEDFYEEDHYGADYDDGPDQYTDPAEFIVVAFVVVIVLLAVLLFVIAVAFLVDAFILGPLEVGCRRFFIRNLTGKAEVKEAAYGFDHNYRNIVKASILRDLYILLWSLLFFIPGIIKSYEYRMIPYLLAEDPQMTSGQAFAVSRQMMNGQKWKTFVLDLSFFGWGILNLLTVGILGIFYIAPYRNMTNAALYERLKQIGGVYPAQEQKVYGYRPGFIQEPSTVPRTK